MYLDLIRSCTVINHCLPTWFFCCGLFKCRVSPIKHCELESLFFLGHCTRPVFLFKVNGLTLPFSGLPFQVHFSQRSEVLFVDIYVCVPVCVCQALFAPLDH